MIAAIIIALWIIGVIVISNMLMIFIKHEGCQQCSFKQQCEQLRKNQQPDLCDQQNLKNQWNNPNNCLQA